jgi:hypothetical protein
LILSTYIYYSRYKNSTEIFTVLSLIHWKSAKQLYLQQATNLIRQIFHHMLEVVSFASEIFTICLDLDLEQIRIQLTTKRIFLCTFASVLLILVHNWPINLTEAHVILVHYYCITKWLSFLSKKVSISLHCSCCIVASKALSFPIAFHHNSWENI